MKQANDNSFSEPERQAFETELAQLCQRFGVDAAIGTFFRHGPTNPNVLGKSIGSTAYICFGLAPFKSPLVGILANQHMAALQFAIRATTPPPTPSPN